METHGKERIVQLQVLIVTHKPEGLARVAAMQLPSLAGVGYLVSCQSQELPLPPQLERDDIEVHFFDQPGVSRNRNNALDLATAPYVLVADDDVQFKADGLRRIIQAFEDHPDADIVTCICQRPGQRSYPPAEHDIWKPWKGYNFAATEIALRLQSARALGLRFNPMVSFGADCVDHQGRPLWGCGEDGLFMLAARAKGAKGIFVPATVCVHPHAATAISRVRQAPILRAEGMIIALKYRFTILPRLLLKAYRLGGNLPRNLLHLTSGALSALRHRPSLLQ